MKDHVVVILCIKCCTRHCIHHLWVFRKFAQHCSPDYTFQDRLKDVKTWKWTNKSSKSYEKKDCDNTFSLSLFIAFACVQFPLSDRSIIPAAWGNTMTSLFLLKFWQCVGSGSKFTALRSTWKYKIWWPFNECFHCSEGINLWSLFLEQLCI